MKNKKNWTRIVYAIGVICLIVGAIDPLEGSIIIASGSILLAMSTRLLHDRHSRIFLVSAIMIVIGVAFLFYFSSLGGFGGNSNLSWWWGVLILPYPIAWLVTIVTLIVRAINSPKLPAAG